jgi:hypothetical protein
VGFNPFGVELFKKPLLNKNKIKSKKLPTLFFNLQHLYVCFYEFEIIEFVTIPP